ncbi:MAG: hypothetical protein JXA18_02845 [Chitinispirillaceae bacterium]|nr:hypothetical protein [Chitinispirillaceae bacterium]
MFCTVLCGVIASGHAEENIRLKAVPMVEAPVIEKKIIRLNIDFVFDRCPPEYWLHYRREEGRLVIEFVGFHIDAPPLAIRGTSVVKDLVVSNDETDMALNKKSARISMAMQEGWHYESWIIEGKVLRLQLWMPLDPLRTIASRRNRLTFWMVLTAFVVAGVTFWIIWAIQSSDSG